MSLKTKITAIAVAFVAVLAIIMTGMVIGYKDSTELLIKQSPFGEMSCVEGQGFYFKGFAEIYETL